MGTRAAPAGLTLGVAALVIGSVPAFAAVGVSLTERGLPFVMDDQVVQCPHDAGEGRHLRRWPNGLKRMRGTCEGELAVKAWTAWHEDGGKRWTGHLEAGRIEGRFRSWHENGVKRARGTYREGLRHGWFKFWHDNGQLASEGAYIAHEEAGCWEGYYPDGRPEFRGAYAEGEKVGKWVFWNAQGTRRTEKYGGAITEGGCVLML